MRTLDEVERLSVDDAPEPEGEAYRHEMARVLEASIDSLPPSYRVVIMFRDVEHMTTTQAAVALGMAEENLRVRLHRARGALRARLVGALGLAAARS